METNNLTEMKEEKQAERQAIIEALKDCEIHQNHRGFIADTVLDRLSKLRKEEVTSEDKKIKDAIAFTLRHIENSLCDQMSNGIFNDFKNTQR